MKILIVDDSKYIRALVVSMLEKLGIQSDTAVDGRDGVEKIKRCDGQFDLVLLDWNMPELDGIGFLETIKKDKISAPPVVMMTTEDEPEKIQRALEYGVVEYIIKPFTEDILDGKIKLALGA